MFCVPYTKGKKNVFTVYPPYSILAARHDVENQRRPKSFKTIAKLGSKERHLTNMKSSHRFCHKNMQASYFS